MVMELTADFHTHTAFCDGRDTAEEMVQEAVRLGMTQLGFSGHMDADIHVPTEEYFTEICRLQQEYKGKLEILCGVELDSLNDPSDAEGADYIIGSTHFLDVDTEKPVAVDWEPEKIEELALEFFHGDYYCLTKAYYELEAEIYARTGCDFIGHFDLITRFNDEMHFVDEGDPRYYKPALETMEYLVSLGIPFEINCGAFNRGRKKELYPNMFLLRHLHDFGGEILISSDAHQKELLMGCFDTAAARARACGFTHTNILTREGSGRVHWKQIGL